MKWLKYAASAIPFFALSLVAFAYLFGVEAGEYLTEYTDEGCFRRKAPKTGCFFFSLGQNTDPRALKDLKGKAVWYVSDPYSD